LAQRIVNNEVPEGCAQAHSSLDLGALSPAPNFPGEFEERLKASSTTWRNKKARSFCFIDDLHTMVGAAKPRARWTRAICSSLRGARRAALRGCDTLENIAYIEKDAALERRFPEGFGDERRWRTPSPSCAVSKSVRSASRGRNHGSCHRGGRDSVASLHRRPAVARQAIDLHRMRRDRSSAWKSIQSPRRSIKLDRRIIILKIEREALKEGDR